MDRQETYLADLPTDCLQGRTKEKPHYRFDSGVFFICVVPET
ncbi:hypothetical protein ACFIQF_19170 [Comamonas sp. J-3]